MSAHRFRQPAMSTAGRHLALAIGLVAAAVALGCWPVAAGAQTSWTSAETKPTDYSQAARWLTRPASPTRNVDVFYLYPTAYRKHGPTDPVISTIDDPGMLVGAESAFARQATAFEPLANIYAPYYRQADSASRAMLPQAQQERIVAGAPTIDARAAFAYYIAHYNHGRPFILAGHSLGSNVLANLLAGYMKKHPAVYKRMIAAYVIGYSITPKYLAKHPYLKFAQRAGDTGVIVSYNTEAPTVVGTNPVIVPGGLAINPITWTRTEAPATAAQSFGSILPDATGTLVPVMHFADARVDKQKGVLISSTPDVDKLSPGGPGEFPRGVFHSYDYPFYYYNLRHNAANRTARFLSQYGTPAADAWNAANQVPAPRTIVTTLGSTPIAQLSGGGAGLPDLGATAPYDAGALVKVLTDYHDSGLYERQLDRIDEVAERSLLRSVKERKLAARPHDSKARARARAKHAGGQWWRKKQAIVFDVDETTLSNWSGIVADGFVFGPKTQAAAAGGLGVAIAPTLELYKVARSHGVDVFYVTGRPESVRRPTAENLAREGFSDYADLMLKPAASTATTVAFKSRARAAIEAKGYRVIASVGDQYSDLAGGHEDWGFKLPNPFYFLP